MEAAIWGSVIDAPSTTYRDREDKSWQALQNALGEARGEYC